MKNIDKILKKYRKREDLIKLLQEVQEIYGYLPLDILKTIGGTINVFPSEIYGIATFYAHFRLKPQKKYVIKVCHGTACHVSGQEAISSTLKENDIFSIEKVACLGCCSLAPCIMIKDKVYGRLKIKDIEGILKKYK